MSSISTAVFCSTQLHSSSAVPVMLWDAQEELNTLQTFHLSLKTSVLTQCGEQSLFEVNMAFAINQLDNKVNVNIDWG